MTIYSILAIPEQREDITADGDLVPSDVTPEPLQAYFDLAKHTNDCAVDNDLWLRYSLARNVDPFVPEFTSNDLGNYHLTRTTSAVDLQVSLPDKYPEGGITATLEIGAAEIFNALASIVATALDFVAEVNAPNRTMQRIMPDLEVIEEAVI